VGLAESPWTSTADLDGSIQSPMSGMSPRTVAVVQVRVVGPLEVRRGDLVVDLAPKERIVLERLALAGGDTVSDEALQDALWPRDAPTTARKTLAGYVHRLRQALGSAAIGRRASGYGLDLGHVRIDVVELEEDLITARRAVMAGDDDTAVSAYRRSLERFRGRPFDGLDDVDAAAVERARLREVRGCAEEELYELLLARGASAEVVPSLEALVAREPVRERAWAQLITAFARCGRQADALDAYARARRALADELGIEPSPQLQAIHRQLLEQDDALFASPSPAGAGSAAPLDRLVGREELLDRIAGALDDHRLVSLVGPGGAGKTRLAQHLVGGRLDAHLVELAPVGATRVPSALLQGLGLDAQAGRAPVEVIARWCAGRRVLIAIDNCEHVIDETAALVVALLHECPDAQILTTSRERLRVRGEVVVDVGPLPTPQTDADIDASPAVALFVERASEADVTLDLTEPDERAAVAAVCRRLDGLPLALELGAAQLRSRSVVELCDDVDVLPVVRRDVPARQQSLDDVVAWSEELLAPPARAAFRRLSVLTGDFDAATACAVIAADPIVAGDELTVLTQLVEASLLMVERRPGRPNRYRLLDTVRRHGARRLEDAGERDATLDALHGWAERAVAVMEAQIRTPQQDEAMALAARERLSFTTAYDHALAVGDHRAALRLAATVPMGLVADRRAALRQLLAVTRDAPPALRARAWSTLANLASDAGDGPGQADAALEALAAATEAGDDAQTAWARYFLVLGKWAAGVLDELGDLIDDAAADFERIGSDHGVASMLWIRSQVEPDTATAIDLADRAIAVFRRLGISSGLAHALEGRALIALRDDDRATVRVHLAEALAIVSDANNSGCTAHCVESVGAYAAADGRLAAARQLLDLATALRDVGGHGMRVWERAGHEQVVAALVDHEVAPMVVPAHLDVAAAAALAQAVLADGTD
jgi:predicted ATPase/DNA-binding SARP family transcriptional activator